MMAVAIEAKPVFSAAKPKLLFEGHYEAGTFPFESNYDVSPDGQRFLIIKGRAQESAATQLNVVLNWSESSAGSRHQGNHDARRRNEARTG
jgi:hypothetical protein